MIKLGRVLLLMLTAVALVSGRAGAADPASDVAALHAADDAWARAYNSGNVDGVAALYDEHAVLLPPGAPAASGRAAIRAFFANDIAESAKVGARFTLAPNPAGGVSADFGWSSGSYTVTDKTGKVLEKGKYLSVSKKISGKWLYVRDTWNADTSPTGASAPEPKK